MSDAISAASTPFSARFASSLKLAAFLAATAVAAQARAATISKADNADDLSLATSWVGGVTPGAADVAVWDSTVTGANSVLLGADLTWLGLQIVDPAGPVTIGGANTLTLGTSGLNMSAATQDLTINSNLAIGTGNQVWDVATGRTFTLTGTFTRGAGGSLLIDKSTNTGTVTAALALTNGIVGPWAVVRSAGAAANNTAAGYNFATVSGGNVVAYTGATGLTATGAWGGIPSGGSGTINYDISSAGNFGVTGLSRNVNTIRYTGTGATQVGNINSVGNLLTINGFMNAGTGTFNIGGTGGTNNYGINVTVGSGNNLVLAAMSADLLLRNGILNGTGGNSAVTILGGDGRAVTISGATSNYSGATYINSGALVVSGAGSINSTSGIIVSGGKYLHTSSVASTRAITLNGGTVDGTGTVGAVTVADNPLATVTHGNGGTTALTLGSLSFNGDAAVNLNLGTGVGLNVTGALLTTPANGTVTINATRSGWALGSTNLIGFGSFGGSTSDFTVGTINGLGARQALVGLVLNGNNIALDVTGELPVWTGLADSAWTTAADGDNSGPNNWATKTGHAATNFWAADHVEFNDTYNLGAGDVAVSNRTIDIQGANVSPGSMTFDNSSGDYTLSSSTGHGIANGSLTKNGSGTLTINTANAYAGGTALNAGTLNVNNASALGTGAITINGGTLDNTSGAGITLSGNNAQAWNADVAFAGAYDLNLGTGAVTMNASRTVTTNGTATLTVGGAIGGGAVGLTKAGSGTLVLGGASSFTGLTDIQEGTLVVNGSLAAASSVNLGNGSSSGKLVVGNNFTVSGLTTSGSGTANAVVGGQATVRTLTVNLTAGETTFNGLLGGASANENNLYLAKGGAGTLIITSSNTFAGGVDIGISGAGTRVGVLRAAADQALGTGTVSIGPGGNDATARLELTGGITLDNTINLAGRNTTTVAIQSLAGNNTLAGRIDLNSGGSTYQIQSDAELLTISGAAASAAGVSISVLTGNRNVTLQGAGNGEVSGVIQNGVGAAAVTKDGSGTWTLSGANTYTGFAGRSATTVLDGRLQLGASDRLADTGSLSLAGGTFATGGFSETLGTLALSADATLDLGDGASILSFAASDTQSWTGTMTITNWSGSTLGGGTDQIYFGNSSAGLTGAQLSQINFVGYDYAQLLSTGEVVGVPEPSTFGLLALGGAALLRRRRRAS